ncbi:hemagglutinin repeat-containing protein [Stenotrophomonas maltophilia group sp. CASM26]|uniref:hemagglutinin repeat-containing protein n=1 Tax=Stenotrophomonas maltophilia group sp. CASM26 TaxID=3111514 RepID=UPI003BF8AA5E
MQVSQRDETVRGSQLSADGGIALSAGRDVNLVAAEVRSDQDAISIGAGRDVNLTSAQEEHTWEQDTQRKRRGLTSTTRTATHDATQDILAVGTVLSAERISIGAGRDITAEGAKIASTGDIVIAAKGNLSIVAAESSHSEQHSSDRKKSGLLGGMNGSFGVTFGSRSSGNSSSLTETIAEGSIVGSALGSVTLTAGETLHIGGSDVLSRNGMTLLGKNVRIDSAEQHSEYNDRNYFRQSGLNVAVGGATVDTIQSARAVYAFAKRADEVEDDRLKALYAYKAAQGAIAVAQAAGQQWGDGGGGAGLNVRVTAGTQRSQSETTMEQTTHRGSTLHSDGDVVIAATGGDLTVVGSNVSGRNVDLAAAKDLMIRSSEDRYAQDSRNQSQGGEIGVAISGSSGGGAAIGVYVGANAARGKADGNGTVHNESIIKAGDRLTFASGGDTTLQGAQLVANQVIGQVAGNLTVRTEQDTDRYKSQQLAAKGEATIGYGFEGSASGSAAMIDSDYRSVREQTGIAAGDGGFQLQVGGNTHLVGAVIASTADPSKNLLSTGSLTVEDLKNRAEFLSASISGGTSGGGSPSDGFNFNPSVMPGLPTGDSKSSTTRSGVADGTIDIRNGDNSTLADLQRGVTGLDNANGFAPIFDEKKVQERQELTQILGEIGFKAVGNLASKKSAQAKVDLEVARANGDAEAEADALRRISEWGESGRNKVLLHGLTGAAVAALSGGDIGGAAAGATGAALAKEAMTRFLTGQGMDPRSGEFNSLIELASAALGGVVGGSDGAGTALLGDQFNRQMHWDQYLEALDVCKANPAVRGCSTILEMSDNTKAVVISDSSDEVAYKVIANQNKETGETVSFTLTESDGTPRLIMQKDEYNDFVVSGLPPPLWGMAPGYALDLGSYFTHGLRGQTGQAFGDLSNIFTSGEYWRDMALALITSAAGAKGGALVKGGKAPPASVASSGEVAVSRGGLAYLDEPPFNPVGSVGSAQVWSSKARIKYVELPTQGRIRYVPPSGYSASNPLPRGPNNGYLDRFGNEWTKGPSRTQGQAFEWDVQLSRTGKAQLGWATRDGSHLNISLDGRITHK